jgi:3-phosphoshikimate 1-carboxyvinyltransferase
VSVDAQFRQPLTESADLLVYGRGTVGGTAARSVSVPGDKSVSRRALLATLLPKAPPRVTITGVNFGGAVRALLSAMRALGRGVDGSEAELVVWDAADSVAQDYRPHPAIRRWPGDVRYVRTEGSSAAARLLIGVLAGSGVDAIIDGDDVLRHRPMDWLVEPLTTFGAYIEYLGERARLPVRVRGKVRRSAPVELAVGSAQARSGVLLAAIAAELPVKILHTVR